MRLSQTKEHKYLALTNYKAINAKKCAKHDVEGSEAVFKKVPILSG